MTADSPVKTFLRHFNEELLPGVQSLGEEAQQHLLAALRSAFNKMDLVSRDEFDAQSAVLKRTREKLEALQTQLCDLEKIINQDKPPAG